MYSGTTLTPLKRFDAWFGAHQKIDRIARRNLDLAASFKPGLIPSFKEIIAFEGLNGPDGIKRKTPAKDEPWHYYNPADPTDDKIIKLIEDQYHELVLALKAQDRTRAAFEMAWLAHALVDGLTPAHHYPYEEELMKLRGGAGKETRTTLKSKVLMPGKNIPETLSNNWKMWGDRGLLATHFAFEWGVAVMISPLRLRRSQPDKTSLQIARTKDLGVGDMFRQRAAVIAELDMYDKFYQYGWTLKLAKTVRRQLVPQIIELVTLVWYKAADEAGLVESKK
jgi:hypothetical protein